MENKICPQCGGDMDYRTGTSKKNGKPYAMWKCRENPEHVLWDDSSQTTTKRIEYRAGQMDIILEEIKNINDRLDQMGKYLRERLEESVDIPIIKGEEDWKQIPGER